MLLKDDTGNKQLQVGLAPVLAPQQRLNANNLYEGQPPEVTAVSAFEQFTGGAGFSTGAGNDPEIVDIHNFTRYHYSRNVDLSSGTDAILSPKRNETADSVGDPIDGAPLQFISTSFGTFMITENVIYEWDTSALYWIARDSSGEYVNGAVEFNGYLFVPRGQSFPYIYSNDGLAWTESTAATTTKYADYFCTRGDDGDASSPTLNVLVRLYANTVSVNTTGLNGTAWGSADTIGPTNQTGRAITPSDGPLFVWKKEGIYAYDFLNVDNVWTAEYLKSDNAVHVFQWRNGFFYANYGDRLLEFDPDGTEPIRYVYPTDSMDSPEVKGAITGIGGDDDNLYITVQNIQGNTYVIKGKPDDAWHTWAFPAGSASIASLPANGADDAGVGTITWSDPGNITADDGAYATALAGTSHYLVASNFGFTVPDNAVIDGVEVDIGRFANGASQTSLTDPTVGANNSTVGTNAWTDPGNITLSDNVYATVATAGVSQGLQGSTYGFAIPSGATIDGIEVAIERKSSLGSSSVVDTQGATAASQNNVVISKPTGTADGDVLVAMIAIDGAFFIFPPSGWTEIYDINTPIGGRVKLYTKVASSEGSTYTFNSSITNWNAGIVALRSIDTNSIVVASSSSTESGVSTFTAPAIVTTSDNSMVMTFFAVNGLGTFTAPAGMSEILDQQATGTTIGIDYVVQASAGSSGAKVSTFTATTTGVSIIVGFNPGGVFDERVSLVKADGSITATSLESSAFWPSAEATATYGGSTELWGETWTDTDINDADFGALLQANVPTSATASVDSIQIRIYYTASGIVDNQVRLWVGGAVAGNNNATATAWPTTDTLATYGSEADLWGNVLTTAIVNASNFGAALSAVVTTGIASVDFIGITIYYTPTGGSQSSQTLYVAGPGYIHDENPVVLTGYGDDGCVYYILPRSNMKPQDDPNYLYEIDFGSDGAIVVGPYVYNGAAAYSKFLNRGTILAENITAGKATTLSYQADGGTETDILVAVSNGLSAENITDDEVEYNRIRYIVELTTTGTSTSPIILGWTFQSTLNAPRYRVWNLITDLVNDKDLLDGMRDYWQDSLKIEDFIFNAVNRRVTFTDPNGRDFIVRLAEPQSLGYRYMKDGNVERNAAQFQLQLIEIAPLSQQVEPLVYATDAWGARDWS